MKIAQSTATECCYILFILGFGLSYPYKVININPDASVFFIFVLLSLIFFIIKCIDVQKVVIELKSQPIFMMILVLNIGYYINFKYFPLSDSIAGNFNKFLEYSIFYIIVYFVSIQARCENTNFDRIGLCILALSICSFVAVVFNSILWRIPINTFLSLDEKYIVGPFLRAGAGYMDPNFLSAFFMINIYSSFIFCKKNYQFIISVLLLLASIVFTFSRAGQALGLLFSVCVFLIRFGVSKSNIKYLLLLLLIVMLAMIANYDVIFERFLNAEGQSSTESRFEQYTIFYNYILSKSDISNLFLSYGGQEFFFTMAGAHLHNFIFSSIFEIGWFFSGVYFLFLVYFYVYYCTSKLSKLVFMFILVMMLFLPTTPEAIFYMLCVITIHNSTKQINNIQGTRF